MLVWEGAGGKRMQVEYTACEWVNPDLEKGVCLWQAGFPDSCAQQLTPKTQAAPLLPRGTLGYEGVALLPAMVRRRDGEVVCPVPGCGKTVPLGRMRIHTAFHLHAETLHPPCCGFYGLPCFVLRMRRVKGGEPQAQPVSCANGFIRKFSMRVASKQGVQAVPVECPVRGCGWQWRHNMRRHCEQHQLPNERAAQWDWGPEELIVLGEGRGAFWHNKRKSWWTQPERKRKRKKMRAALRDALQCDRGEEGGTVPAPPRPRVEEDDSEASAALQWGSDQGRRDLRLAEAQDQDFVPGDSSTSDSGSDSDSDSDSGSSDGSASEEGERTDPQAAQSSATPSGGSRNRSQASASQRDPSPARSTISVSSTSSRGRRPRPQPLSAPPPPLAPRPPAK